MTIVKVIEIDGQTAVLLPPEIAAALNAKPGANLSLVQSSDGAWLAADEEVARQVQGGLRAMHKFDQAFRILAK
jgi:hypothetical protein